MNEADLIAKVMKEDAEYSNLAREHQALDRELKKMEALRFPTTQQEMRMRALKKEKLAKKDMMAQIINRYRAMQKEEKLARDPAGQR